ncbi:MAG: hypothetical protein FWF01_00890 [Alphaproteobacteria bacterium]|nr:hypothetical protein [Alphaproteobacteria bacterium]
MKKTILAFALFAAFPALAAPPLPSVRPPSPRCQLEGRVLEIDKEIDNRTTGLRRSDIHPENDVFCDPRPYYMLTVEISGATAGKGCPSHTPGNTVRLMYFTDLGNKEAYRENLARADKEINRRLREDPATRRTHERELYGKKVESVVWTEAAREEARAFCAENARDIVQPLWAAHLLGFAAGDMVQIDYDYFDDRHLKGENTISLGYTSAIRRKGH